MKTYTLSLRHAPTEEGALLQVLILEAASVHEALEVFVHTFYRHDPIAWLFHAGALTIREGVALGLLRRYFSSDQIERVVEYVGGGHRVSFSQYD
ncbi:hypothetical protein [Deinococcus carri]